MAIGYTTATNGGSSCGYALTNMRYVMDVCYVMDVRHVMDVRQATLAGRHTPYVRGSAPGTAIRPAMLFQLRQT